MNLDKQIIPSWADNMNEYNTGISNDIDSWFSQVILSHLFGSKVKAFYNFRKLYKQEEHLQDNEKLIAVDIDLIEGKCWSNHVTMFGEHDYKNKDAFNLNNFEGKNTNNYFTKYAGSTLLEIISYYKWDISNLSKKAKMILLCIDSTYLGYYSGYELPPQANKHFLCDVLELEELYWLQEKHDISDFNHLKRYVQGEIWVIKNKLQTDIDVDFYTDLYGLDFSLPTDNFIETHKFRNRAEGIWDNKDKDNMMSFALTGRNKCKYTEMV